MNISAYQILVIVALVLSIVGLVKPAWPVVAVGLILVCVAMLVGK